MRQGLVHVYTGDGKGKTTAALGLALRAIGWGERVYIIQFIKGYPDIGEAHFAAEHTDQLILKQFAADTSRAIGEDKVQQRQAAAQAALEHAEKIISSGEYGLVILDEINNALHYNIIDIDRVLALLRNKPDHVEIVLTGRNAPTPIIESADYVTEMKMVKHPYHKGIPARKGIDY